MLDCTVTLTSSKFLWSHLHCAGVSATRLSAGIFPSLIKPIFSINRFLKVASYTILKNYFCGMNYFELFDLPVSIRVDKTQLAKKYFELQKQNHPDFFTQASEYEQADALEKSATLNKALKTLKNEDETLKYILIEKGILQEDEKYQLPPNFLMEVMDLNEDLGEHSKQQIEAFENAIYADVQNLIENYNNEAITTQQLTSLKEYYFKKKYLQRILERIED
jgi:molecular chaperone HscB